MRMETSMIKIFDGSEWAEGIPQNGEKYRVYDEAGGYMESYWSEQFIGSMLVTVNGDSVSRHEATAGQEDTYRIECSLPITDTFRVPLEGMLGAKGKTLIFEFVDGVAERQYIFAESGEWVVAEAQINKHLPHGQQFSFSGLHISVGE